MVKHHLSVLIGSKFVSIGDFGFDEEKKEFEMKPIPNWGLYPGFRHIVGSSFRNVPYEERPLYIVGKGVTETKVRIYWSDVKNNRYSSMMNPQKEAEFFHLKNEVERLENINANLMEMFDELGIEDVLKRSTAKNAQFFGKDLRGFVGFAPPLNSNYLKKKRKSTSNVALQYAKNYEGSGNK